jgi:Concanavalin A-like lectin/glucanases superfamily
VSKKGILCTSLAPYSTNTWYHAVCAFPRADKVYLYINGSQNTSAAYASGNASSVTVGNSLIIASHDGATWYNNGTIDEVRVSSYARSADWIVTEYNNQNSPSTFYTVGSAVSR